MKDFNYEIKDHVGTISHNDECEKAVKLISYNGDAPKIDIRTRRGTKMLKGIALTLEEAKELRKILNSIG